VILEKEFPSTPARAFQVFNKSEISFPFAKHCQRGVSVDEISLLTAMDETHEI